MNTILDTPLLGKDDLVLSSKMKQYLQESAKWAKGVSIIGLIILIFFSVMFLLLFLNVYIVSSIDSYGWIIVLMICVFLVLNFLFLRNIFRFSKNVKLAFQLNDQVLIEKSFDNLQLLFTFFGIHRCLLFGIGFLLLTLGRYIDWATIFINGI